MGSPDPVQDRLECEVEIARLSLESANARLEAHALCNALTASEAELAEWEECGIKLPRWMDRLRVADALEKADGPSWFMVLARLLRKSFAEIEMRKRMAERGDS